MQFCKRLIVFLFVAIQGCTSQSKKINGLSFVAHRSPINDSHIFSVVNTNANYTAIMPFGFIRSLNHPEIVFNTKHQWFGETKEGAKQYAEELKKQNIKIMLKPHIWIWHGEFTGHIEMKNEADWETLEKSYSKFILQYAELAQSINAEMFCIGTELEKFIQNRPNYWLILIKKIKNIYNGKLTYAANWDEFQQTPFWRTLDFIGVNAYFPVSINKTPTIKECLKNWEPHKKNISDISQTYSKPILFTEFGYRSVDYSGKEPWKSDRSMSQVNLDAQTNTTHALFETFWNEDWFAGGFLWKWHHNYKQAGGENNTQFTPQNKPAEDLIKNHYEAYK